MNEASLRKWHRTMGIIVALFLFLQAGTGTWVALDTLFQVPTLYSITRRHTAGGSLGDLYRIVLGLGTMAMAVTGTLIYLKIRARMKK
jgi:hypothetical protein